MQRRGDNEISISGWSQDWIDGSGVERVARWYITNDQRWQVSDMLAIDGTRLAEPLTAIRTSGYARHEAKVSPSITPVVYEMSRLAKEHAGPREERIIEFAASRIPCILALHAVHMRRPLPDDEASDRKHDRRRASMIRAALVELGGLAAEVPLAWGLAWTFGRGPSVGELARNEGSTAQLGAVYLTKALAASEIATVLPAHIVDLGHGYEVALTKEFGGPLETVPVHVLNGLWKLLRKVSLMGLPWDVLQAIVSQK